MIRKSLTPFLALTLLFAVALASCATAPDETAEKEEKTYWKPDLKMPDEVVIPDRGPGPLQAEVPEGFVLHLGSVGGQPGEDGDDIGPPYAIRDYFRDISGDNLARYGFTWYHTQPEAPEDGEATYDFSHVRGIDPKDKDREFVFVEIDILWSPEWAKEFRFSDIPRYNKALEEWAEAACRYVNETYGHTWFHVGGNERDLVSPDQYKPYYEDWHFFYMDPVKAFYRGMKKASEDNKLMIGNLCYNDRDHIGALYAAGAKDHFDMLAVHTYGPRGVHVDMEQLIESRQEMESHGDYDIPMYLTEGWSCFPLPDSIDKDPTFRGGTREYTPAEVEHYRQTVLDGWRNLTTKRPEYDPKWLLGASYFVLNDHWGGMHWEERAEPFYDDNGNLAGYYLDGYKIGTTDPNWVKPLLRPWGLIDFNGDPKGDIVYNFPPYIPKHDISATLSEELEMGNYDPRHANRMAPKVEAGKTYHATVKFTNNEEEPMTNLRFICGDKSEKDYPAGAAWENIQGQVQPAVNASTERKIQVTRTSPEPPTSLAPGETITLTYELVFPESLAEELKTVRGHRIRPYADVYYNWKGRPYHTDAWLPRVMVVN